MCLSYAARVTAVDGDDVVVDWDGRSRRASLLLEPSIVVGDWVLVAAGRVIRRTTRQEAHELQAVLRGTSTPATTHGRQGDL